MTSDSRARLKSWLESGEATLHPLTLPQRELWEAAPLDVRDPANHICCSIDVRGLITEKEARSALKHVVARQDVLRLSFLPGKNGPLQLVRKTCDIAFEFRNVDGGEAGDVEAMADAFFKQPFDFVVGPLYRVLVLRRAADHHLILFCIHHAIGDGWSWGLFVQDLFAAYLQNAIGEEKPLPPLPQSYTAWGAADQAFWSEEELAARRPFWEPRLRDLPQLWDVPISGEAFESWSSVLPADLVSKVSELARKSGATLYSTLLAAFQVAFASWSGMDDVVVGSPFANRRAKFSRETIGYYAVMVPMRSMVDPGATFSDHLRQTHEMTTDCIANVMPFTELVRMSDVPRQEGLNPLYEVRFALQNHPMPKIAMPSLSAKLAIEGTGTPRYQLACEITEGGDALEVVWIANGRLFTRAETERLDALFRQALETACASPDKVISAFGLPPGA